MTATAPVLPDYWALIEINRDIKVSAERGGLGRPKLLTTLGERGAERASEGSLMWREGWSGALTLSADHACLSMTYTAWLHCYCYSSLLLVLLKTRSV